MEVKTAAYQPLAASSYIPLPKKLASKKAVINIQNVDHKCLIWSVLAALHPAKHHPERVSHYLPFESELVMDGITFPTPLHQLDKFEKLNKLSLNVFGWEDDQVLPLRITNNQSGTYAYLF